MRNAERVMAALGGLDDEIVEKAARRQGLLGREARTGGLRKTAALLLAAAIALLSLATAYAADWFGLSTRLTPLEPLLETATAESGILSFNGYRDTPEGQANAEWIRFLRDYESPLSPEETRAWDAAHREEPAVFYHVWDDGAKEKLLEIAERYRLRLHSHCVTPRSEEQFYQLSGLAPFLDGLEQLSILYLYEDGSFSAEAELAAGWIRLDRGAKGVLCPSAFYLRDAGSYEEWQMTTADGTVVNLAQAQGLDEFEGYAGLAFCETGNYLITVQYHVPAGETEHSAAEALMEAIHFSALEEGHTDLSPALNPQAHKAEGSHGLLTVEKLMSSPEYRASVGFQEAFNDWYDQNGRIAVSMRGNGYVEGQYDKGYYGSFPCGRGDLDARLDALATEYGVTPPVKSRCVRMGAWIDPENLLAHMWDEERVEGLGPATQADGWALIGCEPFLDYEPMAFIAWDNGAWQVDLISYLPYGGMNPVLQAIRDPSADCWAYDTACGAQVLLCAAGSAPYPLIPESLILYDSGSGYVVVRVSQGNDPAQLEAAADRIDFSKIP